MKLEGPCVETGCTALGVVGLNGAWLCLDHFDVRLKALQAAQSPLLRSTARLFDVLDK